MSKYTRCINFVIAQKCVCESYKYEKKYAPTLVMWNLPLQEPENQCQWTVNSLQLQVCSADDYAVQGR